MANTRLEDVKIVFNEKASTWELTPQSSSSLEATVLTNEI